MGKAFEHRRNLAKAHSESFFSAAGQHFPWLARRITGLTKPNDVLLRWRAFPGVEVTDEWLALAGFKEASMASPKTWRNFQIQTERGALDEALGDERVPAGAYMLGSIAMVGVDNTYDRSQDRTGDRGFLHPTFERADSMSVVARVGDGEWIGAIGTAQRDGQDFQPLPTEFVQFVEHTPWYLNRI